MPFQTTHVRHGMVHVDQRECWRGPRRFRKTGSTLGMMVCMPQFPLTTWLTEKSTPTVMAVMTWSSVRLNAVIMKSLQWAQLSPQESRVHRHDPV